jgi:hypothetical protein
MNADGASSFVEGRRCTSRSPIVGSRGRLFGMFGDITLNVGGYFFDMG